MAAEHENAAPGPALSGVALGYTGFAETLAGPATFVALPCMFVPLILDLGDGWSVGDARRPDRPPERLRSFAAGIADGPVRVGHPGSARCLQIDLTPHGARRLLGTPMSELANRSVALEDVVGPGAHELVERLAEASGWAARFALIDRALTARLAATPPGEPGTCWALGRIEATGGRVRAGHLARELGWSHRRLIARFRDDIGLPPKAVARIVRFERVRRVLDGEPAMGLAEAAATCGFADQAHLAREVRDLAGMTPTALRAEGVNFVQDPPPAGS